MLTIVPRKQENVMKDTGNFQLPLAFLDCRWQKRNYPELSFVARQISLHFSWFFSPFHHPWTKSWLLKHQEGESILLVCIWSLLLVRFPKRKPRQNVFQFLRRFGSTLYIKIDRICSWYNTLCALPLNDEMSKFLKSY